LLPSEVESSLGNWLRNVIDPLIAFNSAGGTILPATPAGPLPPGVSSSLLLSDRSKLMLTSLKSSIPPLLQRLSDACQRQSSELHNKPDSKATANSRVDSTPRNVQVCRLISFHCASIELMKSDSFKFSADSKKCLCC
jgi:hypothetical protein